MSLGTLHTTDSHNTTGGDGWGDPGNTMRVWKNIKAAISVLQPQVWHDHGDINDFAADANMFVAAQAAYGASKGVERHGEPGNHEFAPYGNNIWNAGFESDLTTEVALTLKNPANAGDTTLYVNEDVSGVVGSGLAYGHQILIMLYDRMAESAWELQWVTGHDVSQKSVTIFAPLAHNYPAGSYLRQGVSNQRCISFFRANLKGLPCHDLMTDTNTNYYYTKGNCVFVCLGMNNYHPFSSGVVTLSSADQAWLEGVISANAGKNVILNMHVPPFPGNELGQPDNPYGSLNTYCIWSQATQNFFTYLYQTYPQIAVTFSGHIHRSFRSDESKGGIPYPNPHTQISGKGNSWWVSLPPTCQAYFFDTHPTEGQVVISTLSNGSSTMVLKGYSISNDVPAVLNTTPFRIINIPLPYAVSGV